eukprot:g6221.t1
MSSHTVVGYSHVKKLRQSKREMMKAQDALRLAKNEHDKIATTCEAFEEKEKESKSALSDYQNNSSHDHDKKTLYKLQNQYESAKKDVKAIREKMSFSEERLRKSEEILEKATVEKTKHHKNLLKDLFQLNEEVPKIEMESSKHSRQYDTESISNVDDDNTVSLPTERVNALPISTQKEDPYRAFFNSEKGKYRKEAEKVACREDHVKAGRELEKFFKRNLCKRKNEEKDEENTKERDKKNEKEAPVKAFSIKESDMIPASRYNSDSAMSRSNNGEGIDNEQETRVVTVPNIIAETMKPIERTHKLSSNLTRHKSVVQGVAVSKSKYLYEAFLESQKEKYSREASDMADHAHMIDAKQKLNKLFQHAQNEKGKYSREASDMADHAHMIDAKQKLNKLFQHAQNEKGKYSREASDMADHAHTMDAKQKLNKLFKHAQDEKEKRTPEARKLSNHAHLLAAKTKLSVYFKDKKERMLNPLTREEVKEDAKNMVTRFLKEQSNNIPNDVLLKQALTLLHTVLVEENIEDALVPVAVQKMSKDSKDKHVPLIVGDKSKDTFVSYISLNRRTNLDSPKESPIPFNDNFSFQRLMDRIMYLEKTLLKSKSDNDWLEDQNVCLQNKLKNCAKSTLDKVANAVDEAVCDVENAWKSKTSSLVIQYEKKMNDASAAYTESLRHLERLHRDEKETILAENKMKVEQMLKEKENEMNNELEKLHVKQNLALERLLEQRDRALRDLAEIDERSWNQQLQIEDERKIHFQHKMDEMKEKLFEKFNSEKAVMIQSSQDKILVIENSYTTQLNDLQFKLEQLQVKSKNDKIKFTDTITKLISDSDLKIKKLNLKVESLENELQNAHNIKQTIETNYRKSHNKLNQKWQGEIASLRAIHDDTLKSLENSMLEKQSKLISNFQEQIFTLKSSSDDQISSLVAKLRMNEMSSKEDKHQIKQLQTELKSSEECLNDLSNNARVRYNDLQNKHREDCRIFNEKEKKWNEKFVDMKSLLEKLEIDTEGVIKNLTETHRSDIERLRREKESLLENYKESKLSIEEMKKTEMHMNAMINKLRDNEEIMKKTHEKAKTDGYAMRDSITSYKSNEKRMHFEIDEFRRKEKESFLLIEAMKKKLEDKDEKVKMYKAENQLYSEKISTLTQNCAESRREKHLFRDENISFTKKIEKLQSCLVKLNSKVEILKNEKNSLENKVKEFEQNNFHFTNKIETLKVSEAMLKATIKDLKKIIQNSDNAKIERFKRNESKLKDELQSSKTSILEMKNLMEMMKNESKGIIDEIMKAHHEEIVTLEREIFMQKESNSLAVGKNAELKALLHSMKDKTNAVTQEMIETHESELQRNSAMENRLVKEIEKLHETIEKNEEKSREKISKLKLILQNFKHGSYSVTNEIVASHKDELQKREEMIRTLQEKEKQHRKIIEQYKKTIEKIKGGGESSSSIFINRNCVLTKRI